MKARPCMSVSDDSVKADLMEIRRLKLQHLKDTVAVNLIGSCLDLLVLTRNTPELGRDQSLVGARSCPDGVGCFVREASNHRGISYF